MRLLIVSNRLPFTLSRENDDYVLKPSSGGLVSGISSYLDFMKNSQISDFEYIWFGWPGADIDEEKQKKFSDDVFKKHSVIPVFVKEDEMDKFYLGFCNSTIWPLFHYFPEYAVFNNEEWEIYKRVNQYFADGIIETAKEDDIIWIHDYHLMLVPKIVREKLGNKVKIGFFLHIPFPSFEVYRILPKVWREEILRGIMGSDLIGFHTNEYTHSFLRSVLRIIGLSHNFGKIQYDNRIVKVGTFPMGIDFDRFNMSINRKEVISEREELKTKLKGLKVILSVDRLDYTKGVSSRLLAYKNFLKKYSEYRKKIVFVLIIVPSRIGVNQYQLMKDKLDKLVSEINSEFGDLDWQPVIYQYKHIPFNSLVALYSVADIALITPLRDGMNLVAKEYIASKKNNGALILSEMAGASKELVEAFIINPNDIDEITDTIKVVVESDEMDLRERLISMQRRLSKYNVVRWALDFLKTLDDIKKEVKDIEIRTISAEIESRIIRDFQRSLKKIILLDYDGTLVPFNSFPNKAVIDREIYEIIKSLSNVCDVVIISGRKADFLDQQFEEINISLVAEHGALIKEKNGNWQIMTNQNIEWKSEMIKIFEYYLTRLPGSFIEEKSFSLVFHYRACDPEMAEIRIKEFEDELINYTSNLNLQIIKGNKVLEVRNYDINKANSGMYFISKDIYEFILFIGDDWTDEDLFKVLRDKNAYTVKIGIESSNAKYHLYSFKDVRILLRNILNATI